MGIDPGLTRMGFGIVDEQRGRLTSAAHGTLRTPQAAHTHHRLSMLFDGLTELISEYRPDAIAVERVFFNLNAKTAVPVIRASGIALLAAARSGAEVHEYSPLEVKQAVVGEGNASKDQVRFMVTRLLSLTEETDGADTSDALALAICHMHSRRLRVLEGGVS